MNDTTVTASGLTVHYGTTAALHGINFGVPTATCTAVIGESGSGKTTLGRAIAGLLPDKATISGTLKVTGRVAYMPQDAPSALNPLRTVQWQLNVVLKHQGVTRPTRRQKALELLTEAGCPDPASLLSRYPHELSGGLAQRVVLATVLATRPRVLVADEPTSALDVSTQARVLDKFRELVDDQGITLVMITHDLRAATRLADRVAVMYRGDLVEQGTCEKLLSDPHHEYTQALVAASSIHPEGGTHGAA